MAATVLTDRYAANLHGVLSCYDRIIITGTLTRFNIDALLIVLFRRLVRRAPSKGIGSLVQRPQIRFEPHDLGTPGRWHVTRPPIGVHQPFNERLLHAALLPG